VTRSAQVAVTGPAAPRGSRAETREAPGPGERCLVLGILGATRLSSMRKGYGISQPSGTVGFELKIPPARRCYAGLRPRAWRASPGPQTFGDTDLQGRAKGRLGRKARLDQSRPTRPPAPPLTGPGRAGVPRDWLLGPASLLLPASRAAPGRGRAGPGRGSDTATAPPLPGPARCPPPGQRQGAAPSSPRVWQRTARPAPAKPAPCAAPGSSAED
jgi:hypothetical protein